MALDQQRNWTIQMADNLEKVSRLALKSAGAGPSLSTSVDDPKPHLSDEEKLEFAERDVYLPDEIIIEILKYVAYAFTANDAQHTLFSATLISAQWYSIALPLLYRYPILYGQNFDLFVRTIVPSKNVHVRESPMSRYVRALDMAGLVHQSSKSMTAKLLGRTAGNLQHFVAPVASFGLNCLAPLSRCYNLQTLDLSLVSETQPLPEIFKATAHMHQLKMFRLPRSTGFGIHFKPLNFIWPPRLENVTLSGGVDEHFVRGVIPFPHTLRHLTIEHCPRAKGHAVMHLLRNSVKLLKNLESLKMRNLPMLSGHALDDVLILLPQLQKLSVSVDYVTPALLDEAHFQHDFKQLSVGADDSLNALTFNGNCLRVLELTNSGNPGDEEKLSPIDILIALDENTVPDLRQVRVAKSLSWDSKAMQADTEALTDALQEKSRQDWENGKGNFPHKSNRAKQERLKVWESTAGVWMIDG